MAVRLAPATTIILILVALAFTVPNAQSKTATTPNLARWKRVAQCESNRQWHINSTYDGGLQFSPATWRYALRLYRYTRPGPVWRYAYQAPARIQIRAAEALRKREGLHHWPHCQRYW
jgi:hypothetical protein